MGNGEDCYIDSGLFFRRLTGAEGAFWGWQESEYIMPQKNGWHVKPLKSIYFSDSA